MIRVYSANFDAEDYKKHFRHSLVWSGGILQSKYSER